MDAEEFRKRGFSFNKKRIIVEVVCFFFRGREMVDFIADYLTNIRSRRVFPNVKPGYMRPMIDDEAPHQGESWEKIFNDIERVIMPGVRRQVSFRNSEKTENIFKVTHWQSPYMHAYFPALNSYPSMLGVNFSIDVRTEE